LLNLKHKSWRFFPLNYRFLLEVQTDINNSVLNCKMSIALQKKSHRSGLHQCPPEDFLTLHFGPPIYTLKCNFLNSRQVSERISGYCLKHFSRKSNFAMLLATQSSSNSAILLASQRVEFRDDVRIAESRTPRYCWHHRESNSARMFALQRGVEHHGTVYNMKNICGTSFSPRGQRNNFFRLVRFINGISKQKQPRMNCA
jgi:hypothetical protein